MTPPASAIKVPVKLEHLHRMLAIGLSQRHGIPGAEALQWASAVIEVLQNEIGGDRLGSKGFYIPTPNRRELRNQRIRDAIGPPPHRVVRVREIATIEGCGIATVWRALRD